MWDRRDRRSSTWLDITYIDVDSVLEIYVFADMEFEEARGGTKTLTMHAVPLDILQWSQTFQEDIFKHIFCKSSKCSVMCRTRKQWCKRRISGSIKQACTVWDHLKKSGPYGRYMGALSRISGWISILWTFLMENFIRSISARKERMGKKKTSS